MGGDPWTEQQLGRVEEAAKLNEKGDFGSNTKPIADAALARELSSEPLFSGRTQTALKNKIKEAKNALAAEAAKNKPKPPPSYKKKDETQRYDDDWNAPYKLLAILALLAAAEAGAPLLTLLEIKNASIAALPEDHDLVFDDVAFIDAMNTAIYLGQIEKVRQSDGPTQFKLKEEFITKRNKVLKKLGREDECTKVVGKGK